MGHVGPHIQRVDSIVSKLATVKANADGLVSSVNKKIAAAEDATAAAIAEADVATKKLLADADAEQEKLLEKVEDDLKAGTDAMEATYSTFATDQDKKERTSDSDAPP